MYEYKFTKQYTYYKLPHEMSLFVIPQHEGGLGVLAQILDAANPGDRIVVAHNNKIIPIQIGTNDVKAELGAARHQFLDPQVQTRSRAASVEAVKEGAGGPPLPRPWVTAIPGGGVEGVLLGREPGPRGGGGGRHFCSPA